MLPITDQRTDYEKRLYNIETTDFFIWNEEVYRRIETTKEADIRYIGECIPAVHQRSGELQLIGRAEWVMPCRCELTIIE